MGGDSVKHTHSKNTIQLGLSRARIARIGVRDYCHSSGTVAAVVLWRDVMGVERFETFVSRRNIAEGRVNGTVP